MSTIKGGQNSIVRRAQKIQSQLSKLHDEMGERTIETQVGGGAVKLVINGNREVTKIEIDPEIVDRDELDSLQELLQTAFNEAIRNVQEMIDTETSKLSGGINMPWML